MRVIIDANVWISYLLTRDERRTVRQLIRRCLTADIALLVPPELLDELAASITTHSHLAARIAPPDLAVLLYEIRQIATVPPSLSENLRRFGRDPKDDYLVAYALVHQADYLVTGDDDLLALDAVDELRIVSPVVMLRLLEAMGE
jgi:putative PIN family toxin of toxin-antitoxin system